MKKLLVVVSLICFAIKAKGQLHAGVTADFSPSKEKGMRSYFNIAGYLKKNIRNDLNVSAGLGFKVVGYNFNNEDFLKSDFILFVRDKGIETSYLWSEQTAYINNGYITLPIAVEAKVNRFFRVQYEFSPNFRLYSNKDVILIEGGKESMKPIAFMSSISGYLYIGGVGAGLGVSTMHNGFINTKKEYHYQYMKQYQESIWNSWVLNLKVVFDVPLIKKKRIL